MTLDLRIRFEVDDEAVSRLHAAAFGAEYCLIPWSQRLERHSLTWIGAFEGNRLVGFVHAVWDGGVHAFLLDTVVAPYYQREGVGTALVQALADDASRQGCRWLHVDYEPHLEAFYRNACGFADTGAGLLDLT